jgi:hypothetical protein
MGPVDDFWTKVEIAIASTLPVAILVAILTAWLAARFALGRFRRERHWDLKLDAYRSILDALHRIRRYFDVEYDDLLSHKERSDTDERRNQIISNMRQGHADLERLRDVTSLVISPLAITELRQLEESLEKAKQTYSWDQMIMNSHSAVSHCLERILFVARMDLGLDPI